MSFYEEHCVYLPAMLGWFTFSALLTAYNKEVFGSDEKSFPSPLFMTSIHFLLQWVFSFSISSWFPKHFGEGHVKRMPWSSFLRISIPCGMVASLDIGASNLALVRITMSFYTMVKASSPIFVLAFAFLFGIERVRCRLILVVLVISFGEYLTVRGEVDFDLIGLILCLFSSVLSGLRWTLVQLLLSKMDPPLKTTVETMRVLSPTMAISMIFLSIIIEQPWIKLSPSYGTDYFANFGNGFSTLCLGTLGACLAISMVLCEFYLIMHSTAMVLMIGGVLKELITIFVGVEAFHDKLNVTNIVGCVIIFMGAIMYKYVFHVQKLENKASEDVGRVNVEYKAIKVDHPSLNGSSGRHYKDSTTEHNTFAGCEDALQIEEFLVNENLGSLDETDKMESLEITKNGDIEFAHNDKEDKWESINRLREDLDDDLEYTL